MHCRILDGVIFIHGQELSADHNVILNDIERMEYIDESGNKLVYAKNFPPSKGADNVFSIMSEFGEVCLIMCSNWSGNKPFNYFIGYKDEASVSTALMWNESQLVWVRNMAYKQTFERLKQPFHIFGSIHRYNFIDMELPFDANRCAFVISNVRKVGLGFQPIPAGGISGALINYYPHAYRYNFKSVKVNLKKQPTALRSKLTTIIQFTLVRTIHATAK